MNSSDLGHVKSEFFSGVSEKAVVLLADSSGFTPEVIYLT